MKNIQNPVKGTILLKYPLGNIYQSFGENVELYKKAINSNGHNGIDIVAKQGTPLLATAGEIVEVKNTPEGYGKHIRILTEPDEVGNFLELVYGHCDTIYDSIIIGSKVLDGQTIATMGNTGFIISNSTPFWGTAPAGVGVHLHFGVRKCSIYAEGKTIKTYFNGKVAFIYDYNNGLFGYLDPMKFIEAPDNLIQIRNGLLGLIISLQKKIEEILKGRKIIT